jgi:myo-inositol 2-dehydrogenase / D-chiro-inositol 1-dehydrogenase
VSDPLRVGVIGTGRIGRMHAELLRYRLPALALGGVHDADADTAREVGATLGAPVYDGAEELIGSRAVDAVAICASARSHVDLIVATARAGKPIFCEKPLSLELTEIDRALAEVEQAGVLLQVGFNRRFDPGHQAVRAAVATGEIGDVELVRISSRDPAPPPLEYTRGSGGLFLDTTIHDFDMARYVTGSEVVEIFARGTVRIDQAVCEFDDVDTAVVTLVHEDGVLTTIDNSRRAVYGYDQRVEAFGSAGMASSDNLPAHGGVVRTADSARSARLPHFFLERYVPSYLGEWEAFAAAVRVGGPSPVSGADGRAPLVLGLAARLSAREGRPVAVSEIAAITKP